MDTAYGFDPAFPHIVRVPIAHAGSYAQPPPSPSLAVPPPTTVDASPAVPPPIVSVTGAVMAHENDRLWDVFHIERLRRWEALAAARAAGVVLRSWLDDRRWAKMFRNAALTSWIGELSPAAAALARECLGCLHWCLVILPSTRQGSAPPTGYTAAVEIIEPPADAPPGSRSARVTRVPHPRALLGARQGYFATVVNLAHRWANEKPLYRRSDKIELIEAAELECYHSIETWWPGNGCFSTWLFSRLDGVYTARLRALRKAPIPDALVTSLSTGERPDVYDQGDRSAAMSGPGEPPHWLASQESEPWSAVDDHADAQRVRWTARLVVGRARVILGVCDQHRAKLNAKKWQIREWSPRTAEGERAGVCPICEATAGTEPAESELMDFLRERRLIKIETRRRRRPDLGVAVREPLAADGVSTRGVPRPARAPGILIPGGLRAAKRRRGDLR